ncbi:MAG: phosphatase PAP2 family protein [Actinomycetota bacterium]
MGDRIGNGIVRTAVGTAVFLAAASAAERSLSEREVELFRGVNGLPDSLLPAVWTVMQFGTFATIPVLGVIALRSGRRELALRLAAGGVGGYLAARLAKRSVERARPGVLLSGVHLRGAHADDDGFPSGHAAVSAALAVAIGAGLPAPWGDVAGGLAAMTSLARVYVGAHLPLDVVGGAGLGVALASALEILRSGRRSAIEQGFSAI